MNGLIPFRPDREYCTICHSPAPGRCAVCHAWICADCAELVQGLSRPLVVCPPCAERRPRPGRRLLAWLLVPALILVGLAVGVMYLST